MKIVSFNLKCAKHADDNMQKEREPRIAAFLLHHRPASVGFQETEPFWRERLDTVLTGYLRAQPQLMTKNYIYYDPQQVSIINHGVIWLSETPDMPSQGYGSKYFISATWAIFESLADSKRYVHINTHLDAFNEPIREKEIAMVMELADSFRKQDLPVVMTGDFNSEADSVIYRTILENGWLDAKHQTKDTTMLGTFNDFGKYEPPYMGPIDYFFINPSKWLVKRYSVTVHWEGEFMTDHNVLCLEADLA